MPRALKGKCAVYTRYPLRERRGKIQIYGDESSHTAHRYMVLGALITGEPHRNLEQQLRAVKEQHYIFDEIKWNKVPSRGKFLDGYQALIRTFQQLPLRFKAFVVDTVQYPLAHIVHSDKNEELGFYKYFFQLLYTGIIRRDPRPNYQIYLDPKTKVDEGSVDVLERCINRRAMLAGFPDMWNASCCIIEEWQEPCACLQLTDLLTGMIAAKWNRKIKSAAKLDFIAWSEGLFGVDLWKPSKPYGNHKIDIWPFLKTTC